MEREAGALLSIPSRSTLQKANIIATFLQQDRVQGFFHLCSDKVSFYFLFSNLVESGEKKIQTCSFAHVTHQGNAIFMNKAQFKYDGGFRFV